ncbi:TPA: DUF3801 domain-containing protein [Streptococcus suis]|uniref:DUF3801 domain-containing protein n=1 Tax=Streptococcus suis TaxID=1307 RepID=UPI00209A6E9C|nr:DUF3801 domain-containing protein [Streptococcus suis]MCO8200854.1 DUF3801 domain-containing protein [Streptococcus suis]MCO8218391.1 DUF3801 domain-containing protein [Streptococcus suis]HEM3467941.1 DUF3801 domain-containing protein [Streptococcus suis]HEM3478652.1 DUF3801 domain-containing protein [Streptococcus suis]
MDEERQVVTHLARTGAVTGDYLLRLLELGTSSLLSSYRQYQPSGQVTWDRLLQTPGAKDIQVFLQNQVNLQAFKNELEKLGIGFAFQQGNDGKTQLLYHFKNKALVENALEKVIKQIVDSPQKFKDMEKTVRTMTPAEKLNYYKKEEETRMAKQVTKTPAPLEKGAVSK